MLRDVKFSGHDAAQGRRNIADQIHLKFVLQSCQIGQMVDLGDGAAADDAESYGGHEYSLFYSRVSSR